MVGRPAVWNRFCVLERSMGYSGNNRKEAWTIRRITNFWDYRSLKSYQVQPITNLESLAFRLQLNISCPCPLKQPLPLLQFPHIYSVLTSMAKNRGVSNLQPFWLTAANFVQPKREESFIVFKKCKNHFFLKTHTKNGQCNSFFFFYCYIILLIHSELLVY